MDVWDDDEDEGERQGNSTRDTERLRQKHYNEGYKESLQSARDDALQGGFENGFSEGYVQGLLAGRIIGLCSCAVDLAPVLGLSCKGDLEKVLQDAKALNTESARKSDDFVSKVKQVDADFTSLLPSALKAEFQRGNQQ